VESGLLLDIVITQSSSILELLSGKNQTLLIRWNPLLVLDLGLHIVDSVARLYFKGDGLTRQGLDKAVLRKKRGRNVRALFSRFTFSSSTNIKGV